MKLSVFIASSLDGFIARENGNLDWLNQFNETVPQGEDCGYHSFFNDIDVLVMGKNSYETVLSFDTWPYGNKPVVVLSRSKTNIPDDISHSVSAFPGTPWELVSHLSSKGYTKAYIDGGLIIQSFLREDLIDDITLTVIPILIGSGKRLFGEFPSDKSLQLVDSKAYDFGCVQLKYNIK